MLAIAIGADSSSLLYSSYENGMGRKETDEAAAAGDGGAARRPGSAQCKPALSGGGGGRAQT